MATESSAVVRFIELAQKQPLFEPTILPPDPTDPFQAVPRRRMPVVVGLAVLAAACAIGIGVVAAKTRFWVASEPGANPSPVKASPVAAGLIPIEPPPVAPPAAAALVATETAMPAEPGEEAPAPEPGAIPSANTGFDIRAEPAGTRVHLDGKELGAAPLRVRHLAPGSYAIQLVGPEGYFTRHLEVVLEEGNPLDLRIELEPVTSEPIIIPLAMNEELEAVLRGQAGDLPAADASLSRAERRRLAREERRRERAERQDARRELASQERTSRVEGRRSDPAAAGAEDADLTAVAAVAAGVAPAARAGATDETGTLRLGSKPPCEIHVNGEPTGLTTPQRSIELPAGTHRVRLVNRDVGIDETFRVRVQPGRSTTVIRDLTGAL